MELLRPSTRRDPRVYRWFLPRPRSGTKELGPSDDKCCFWYDLKVQPFAFGFANMHYADRSFFCFQPATIRSALPSRLYLFAFSHQVISRRAVPGAEFGFDDRLISGRAAFPSCVRDAVKSASRRPSLRVFQHAGGSPVSSTTFAEPFIVCAASNVATSRAGRL